MIKVNLILCGVLIAALSFLNCGKKIVPSLIKDTEVIITKKSDPIPENKVRDIVKRANLFCKRKGYDRVSKLILTYSAKINTVRVIYRCL